MSNPALKEQKQAFLMPQEPFHYGILYNLAREIVFHLEGENSHRLTRGDLQTLRLCTDANAVNELEKTIVVGRSALLLAKILGGASEGTTVFSLASGGTHANTTLPLATAGLMATDFLTESIASHTDGTVSEKLGTILRGIARNYQADARLNSLEDLDVWAQRLTQTLSLAEETSPPLIEISPSLAGINCGLLASGHDASTLLTLSGAYILASYLAHLVLKEGKTPFSQRFKTRLAHFLSSNAKYAPVIAAQLNSSNGGTDVLGILTTSLAASHISPLVEDAEEVQAGRQARKDLHTTLPKLDLSIVTPTQLARHNDQISQKHQDNLGCTEIGKRNETVLLRYHLMDDAIEREFAGIPVSERPTRHLLLHDFVVKLQDREFLIQKNDLHLAGGYVHQMVGDRGSGKSVFLKSLGGDYVHQSGLAMVRGELGDIEQHQTLSPEILYFGCKNIPYSDFEAFDIFDSPMHSSIIAEIRLTGLFTEDEINALDKGMLPKDTSRSLRSRLKIASAPIYHPSTQVYLFDDPYADLTQEEALKVTQFLANLTYITNKIVVISPNSALPSDHVDYLKENGVLGDTIILKDKDLIKAK